ncbi:MAG: hypothetical protein OXS32_10070 [Verrucomicrobiales bacterium]|nr:hypothetical protein [Verrucomicrobiales bacterium]
MQKMFEAFSNGLADSRKGYHLLLGQLITKLENTPSETRVRFSHGPFAPGCLFSYRGYYTDLAFEVSTDLTRTAGGLLAECHEALGKEFTGYKGGDYVARTDTPLWASDWGSVSGVGIIHVVDENDALVLLTKVID